MSNIENRGPKVVLWKLLLVAAIVLAVAILTGCIFAGLSGDKVTTPPSGIACIQDAKQCPDGSFVSRHGAKCEFTPCQADHHQDTQSSNRSREGLESPAFGGDEVSDEHSATEEQNERR